MSGPVRTGLYIRATRGLRLRDKQTERLARRVRVMMPWLEPSDYPAVRAWAELEYLSNQVYAFLRGAGLVGKDGEPRRLLKEYRSLRSVQSVIARELGMTPASRLAVTGRSSGAFDLAQAMARAQPVTDAEVVEPESRAVVPVEEADDGNPAPR